MDINKFTKIMRVFISSPTKEMVAFREQAEIAVKEVGMTYQNFNKHSGAGFTQARGSDIFKMNRYAIQSSDVFIGLYGFDPTWSPSSEPVLVKNYLEIAENSNKSMLEYEYDWANQAELYMFPFVRTNDTIGAIGSNTLNPQLQSLYEKLRARSIGWLSNPNEFHVQVKEALTAIIPRIFLSYSRKNIDTVINLQSNLREQDIYTWRDEANIPGGTEWEKVIEAAIDKMNVMIVVLTKESIKSEWVEKECKAFIEKRKPIVPLILDNQVKDEIPKYLSQIHYIDGTSPFGLSELIKRLRIILEFGD